MIDPTVLRGFSEANGILEDHLHLATELAEVAALRLRDVLALELDRPLGRLVQAHHHAASVDLPHPVSPTRPSVSPLLISRSTPSTACTSPIRFWNRIPRVIGKSLRSPRMRTSGVSDGRRFGLRPFGDLDAHERAMTSSWKMRSLSASERWHREA